MTGIEGWEDGELDRINKIERIGGDDSWVDYREYFWTKLTKLTELEP
jgi:hypothetical protein